MIRDLFVDALNRIRNSIIKNYITAYIRYNKRVLRFLKMFIELGLIKSYEYCLFKKQHVIQVNLLYVGQWVRQSVIQSIKKHNQLDSVSFNSLRKLMFDNAKQEEWLISTTSGITMTDEALNKRKGGKLLFYIK